MLLTELIELFEKASKTESPYPSKESLSKAVCAIENDQDLRNYVVSTLVLSNYPEWQAVKSGLQQSSFGETVKNAKILHEHLLAYREASK